MSTTDKATPTVRIICQLVDSGRASHVGGPVETEYHTFDVEAPAELVKWMAAQDTYLTKTIVGAEYRPLASARGKAQG